MNEYISIIFYYFELSGIFQEQGTHFIGRLEVMKLNNKLMLGFQENQSFFHDTWPNYQFQLAAGEARRGLL